MCQTMSSSELMKSVIHENIEILVDWELFLRYPRFWEEKRLGADPMNLVKWGYWKIGEISKYKTY